MRTSGILAALTLVIALGASGCVSPCTLCSAFSSCLSCLTGGVPAPMFINADRTDDQSLPEDVRTPVVVSDEASAEEALATEGQDYTAEDPARGVICY